MKSLTSKIKTMHRLRNWLAVIAWFCSLAETHATTVAIANHTPTAIIPDYAQATINVDVADVVIDYVNNDTAKQLIVTVTGASSDGDMTGSYYYDYSRPYQFTIYNYSDDVTIAVDIDNATDCVVIPYAEVSSVVARMHQSDGDPPITEANYDQDVYFKAVTSPNTLPAGVTFDSILWGGAEVIAGPPSPWAKRTTDNTPGQPLIWAAIGNKSQPLQVWMVKVTLKSWKCSGTGFREILRDPPNQNEKFGGIFITANNVQIQLPHWTEGGETCPVLYQVGQKLKLQPRFTVEPADWTGNITYRGSGGYNFDNDTQPRLISQDFEPPAKDANTSLPDGVGHEEGGVTYVFQVGESDMSPAGMGYYDLYLALDGSTTECITVVDIACHGVSGTTAASVFDSIWTAKFASKSMTRWRGGPLRYYGSENTGFNNASSLIANEDGDCDAWVALFQAVQSFHAGLIAERKVMSPTNFRRKAGEEYYLQDTTMYSKVATGQGSTGSAGPFNYHAGAVYNHKCYDPALGLGPYTLKLEWDNAVFDFALYARRTIDGFVFLPAEPFYGVAGVYNTLIETRNDMGVPGF